MKTFLLFITILIMAISPAHAKGKKSHKAPKASSKKAVTKNVSKNAPEGQLGTAFSFDAASVRGKYQMAGQGIAAVEDEKVLDDLLGLRRSFRDREAQESTRW
ncbi:MAG: hypothetical protein IT287_02405 [Bdellovibrionaceae bacterium]|nr:hypothetical protein [Pseudobdellovibrionaceae bacterium]